jgi:hypothetical protein
MQIRLLLPFNAWNNVEALTYDQMLLSIRVVLEFRLVQQTTQ